ncbi:MAG TPA: hypothetical protein VI278_11830 [Nitrososphaeraceae archaeon]|jgi:hypothetical protein
MTKKKSLSRRPLAEQSLLSRGGANRVVSLAHGLYLARPKEIYTISSGIGVTAAITAAFQPYLLANF